jgi:hypothetical protein
MEQTAQRSIETAHAVLDRVSPALLEIRFKPGIKLDAAGVGEVILAKRPLCTEGTPDVLAVLPESVEVEMRAVTVDHHALHGACRNARRLAVVAPGPLNPKLVEIHYRYHPREHATRVFTSELDARHWLADDAPRPSLL